MLLHSPALGGDRHLSKSRIIYTSKPELPINFWSKCSLTEINAFDGLGICVSKTVVFIGISDDFLV